MIDLLFFATFVLDLQANRAAGLGTYGIVRWRQLKNAILPCPPHGRRTCPWSKGYHQQPFSRQDHAPCHICQFAWPFCCVLSRLLRHVRKPSETGSRSIRNTRLREWLTVTEQQLKQEHNWATGWARWFHLWSIDRLYFNFDWVY
jgi:hypothetical protein